MSTPSTADGRSVAMAKSAPTPTIGIAPAMTTVATFGSSLLFGLIFGALYGYTGRWATRGVRDFSSVQCLSAGSYEVQVTSDLVSRAQTFTTR